MSALFLSALSSGLVFVIIGAFGSLVELVGKAAKKPRIESAGKAIEAFAADLPKLYANVVAMFKGVKK